MSNDFFHVKERGSTVGREMVGGLTTFMTMAYIVVVNPAILSGAGVPFNAALTATCLGAAIITLLMGLITSRPIALASGMGINATIAAAVAMGTASDWRVAMGAVFLEGVIILILVLCGLREAIMKAIPEALRYAIGIGIGLMICLIGLEGGGIVAVNEATAVSLGDLTQPTCIVAVISIILAIAFQVRNIKGGLIWSILISTVIAIPLGVTSLPESWYFGFDLSSFAAPFQKTDAGVMAIVEVVTKPALLLLVFSLLMSDFFDTMGTVFAIGQKGDFADDKGNVKNLKSILAIDSAAAAFGGFIGASSITTFVESVSGVTAGARTGLSNILIALLFFLCIFLTPLFAMIPSAATCGALVVVGYLMMTEIGHIKWSNPAEAIPSFAIIAGIPLTYSITNGIGFGFILYCVCMLVAGKGKKVHPLMYIVGIAFLAAFIFG